MIGALLPLIVTNVAHMVLVKRNGWAGLSIPIHVGAFGANKTWRGVVFVSIVNAVLLSTLRVPMEVPEAMVDKVLDALLSVQLPVPNSASPEDAPEITPLRVTSPVPPKEVAAPASPRPTPWRRCR